MILSQVLSEILLICSYPLFSVLVHFVPPRKVKNPDGPVIVIVERWLSININHIYWKYYLQRRGYKVYLANFPIYKGSFDESAQDLQIFIEQKSLKDVTLVGISSGGITSLLYLQEYDGWNRVKNFISIGSPFEGSWAALVLSWLPSGRELLPHSSLTKRMNEFQIKNLDRIYCFYARIDQFVPTGSVLRGAKKVLINIVGHNNLHLRIKETYRRISEIA